MTRTILESKTFPVLSWGRAKDDPACIPWGLAQKAYIGYAKENGSQQSLERLAERGGFGVEELDKYVPGWRAYRVAGESQ